MPLLDHLAGRGIWCCGTVRAPKLPGLPKEKQSDKLFQKKQRGTFEEREIQLEECKVNYVKWLDNKPVNLVSTFAKAYPSISVSRFERKSSSNIDVTCPDIVKRYNASMGGVNLAAQLMSLYRINLMSKKYYHRLIFHMLEMSVINLWQLYRRDAHDAQIQRKDTFALAELISFALVKAGKPCVSAERGRPSSSPRDSPVSKNRKTVPQNDVRFDNIDHFPIIEEKRNRCKRENCTGKTVIVCQKCKVNLCLNKESNCFHKK